MNSRVSGLHGYCNIMAKASHGVDQIDAYLALMRGRPLKFKSSQSCHRVYKFKNKKGNFDLFDTREIEKLPTLASFMVLKTSEKNFKPNHYTIFSYIALIHLSATTEAEIERDTAVLQQLEQSGSCFS